MAGDGEADPLPYILGSVDWGDAAVRSTVGTCIFGGQELIDYSKLPDCRGRCPVRSSPWRPGDRGGEGERKLRRFWRCRFHDASVRGQRENSPRSLSAAAGGFPALEGRGSTWKEKKERTFGSLLFSDRSVPLPCQVKMETLRERGIGSEDGRETRSLAGFWLAIYLASDHPSCPTGAEPIEWSPGELFN